MFQTSIAWRYFITYVIFFIMWKRLPAAVYLLQNKHNNVQTTKNNSNQQNYLRVGCWIFGCDVVYSMGIHEEIQHTHTHQGQKHFHFVIYFDGYQKHINKIIENECTVRISVCVCGYICTYIFIVNFMHRLKLRLPNWND